MPRPHTTRCHSDGDIGCRPPPVECPPAARCSAARASRSAISREYNRAASGCGTALCRGAGGAGGGGGGGGGGS